MNILVNAFEEADRITSQIGGWVVASIETHVSWPTKKQVMQFDGKDFVLLPVGDPGPPPLNAKPQPGIALRADTYNLSHEEARKEIARFASALAWRERAKIEIVAWTGGGYPRPIGIIRNAVTIDYLDDGMLPVAPSETAAAALAFYREGISLDNPFYAFLSFYKAFSVAIPEKQQRKQWIINKKATIDDHLAKERLTEIEADGTEVEEYLYSQCRHAIAHADQGPFVNPDNTDDHYRLQRDLPLMRNLAELSIEERCGIQRPMTIYREHLYELDGFRNLLPADVLDHFRRKAGNIADLVIDFPDEFLLVGCHKQHRHPLQHMTVSTAAQYESGLVFDFKSPAEAVWLRVFADFAEERLIFDPIESFVLTKNRTDPEQIREVIAGLRFQRCILGNGQLEIWDTEKNVRLGCTSTFIPVNCMVNFKFFDSAIQELEAMLGE